MELVELVHLGEDGMGSQGRLLAPPSPQDPEVRGTIRPPLNRLIPGGESLQKVCLPGVEAIALKGTCQGSAQAVDLPHHSVLVLSRRSPRERGLKGPAHGQLEFQEQVVFLEDPGDRIYLSRDGLQARRPKGRGWR